MLEALARSGMNVARVNLSHGEHAERARRIAQVRETAQRLNEPLAVLADLPGPKFRVGALPAGGLRLEDGTRVAPATGSDAHGALPMRDPELLAALREGEQVYLADGAIELRVAHAARGRVECEVVAGGIVRSGSDINVPDSALAALIPTAADRRHLQFALSQQVDWIGVSLVQSADDLARVRALLPPREAPLLMAKIEKRRARSHRRRRRRRDDGARRPGRRVDRCGQRTVDGTDAVMLSAETAVGRFPVAAVRILQRVLAAAESECAGRMALERRRPRTR